MFGFIPHNIELYKLALIHKSASVVLEDGRHINNERLEFLGDAVLECVSSDYLFIEFPDKNEGFLTQLRSKMVSRQTLNEVAKRIGLDDYVITHSSNNLSQKHIYGDAFEAMMGAIYLDQGYDFVNRLLINRIFVDYIKVATLLESETDFKSRLIEWCQKNHHTIHFATTHDKTYSSNHPFFYSKVLIDNMEVGYGAGDSKKEAEQRAAHSVSLGVSDEDCAKLLDKLDNIDSVRAPKSKTEHQPKAEQKPKPQPKPQPKAEVKAEPKSEPKTEPKAEPKVEVVAENKPEQQEESAERKSTRAPRRRRVAKSVAPAVDSAVEQKSEEVSTPTPAVAQEDATSTPEKASEKSSEKVAAKPAQRRSSRRRNGNKEATAGTAETTTAEPKKRQPKAVEAEQVGE
ncbi:MAG: ribonuclease III [Alistipes sp.]|nr:ribonuclease III [Alistipes sp.]